MSSPETTLLASPTIELPPPATAAEIDRSCRVPLLFLGVGALKWLVLASLFGLVASVKLHAPRLLSDWDWFTYGRLQPLQLNLFLYGFAVPGAAAAALWLLARLGRVPLALPWMATMGALFWNIGVLIGGVGILIGDLTGFEGFEMPRYALAILFSAHLLIGISAGMTFHQRRERTVYVSQWFLFAGLLWFAWIFSTAGLLLLIRPVRGILQSVINWWYLHNLQMISLGFVGMALVFYLVPKLARRELHSRYLGMVAFWTLLLFGSLGGIHPGAPLPAWMPALSTVATVFTGVGIIAVGLNVWKTREGATPEPAPSPSWLLIQCAAAAFLVASALMLLGSLRGVSAITHFTLFTAGLRQLYGYGFLTLGLFAFTYHVFPRLTGSTLPSGALSWINVRGAVAGILLQSVPLVVGGWLQGRRLADPSVAFLDAWKPGLMFLRISTLGDLLMLLANGALLLNVFYGLFRLCREHWWPTVVDAARARPVEVNI